MQTQATENNDLETTVAIQADTEEKSVLNLLRLIFKRWWLFTLIGLAGGIWGVIYAGMQKPVYESYLSFALDEGGRNGGDLSGALGIAAQFGISLGGAKDVFSGENILEIMKSRRIIERVLLSTDTFDSRPYTFMEYYLQKLAIPSGRKIPGGIHYLPGEDRKSFSYAKDSLLYNVYFEFEKRNISAFRPNKKLNVFEVSVTSSDEKFTKKFTDKLIESTNYFYTEISSKKSREILEILESRVPEMKDKLNASISNSAAAQDANVNPAFAAAQVPILKEKTNAQVYGTAYTEMFKNLEMARFQYLKSIPLMQVIDKADYPMKKVTAGKLKTAVIFSLLVIFISVILFSLVAVLRSKKSRV